MKKIGKLFVCLFLVACGGSSSSHHTVAPAPAPAPKAAPERTDVSSMPSHEAQTYASGGTYGSGSGSASAADTDDVGKLPTSQTPPSTSPSAPSTTSMPNEQMIAKAELKSVKDGTSLGTITFTKTDSGQIQIDGTFTGLGKDGVHALYVHENGDCSAKAKKVGKDLNPTHAKWGPPASSTRHAGDFGNLTADDAGNATFSMTTDSITMEDDRPDGILNRAIVIHVKKDAKSGVGGALACGVITMQ